MYYVYILRCRGGTLYTGITTDVRHRMRAHLGLVSGGAKYTHAHPPEELAALWRMEHKTDAARMEYAIKKLTRTQKERLIAAPHTVSELLPKLCEIAMTHLPDVTLAACLEEQNAT